MAKMFYTLDEAKATLSKNEEEIKQYTREGRLREFRDGPRLMYKADQVEALKAELAGGDPVDIGASDSGMAIGLADSKGIGSGLGSGIGSGIGGVRKRYWQWVGSGGKWIWQRIRQRPKQLRFGPEPRRYRCRPRRPRWIGRWNVPQGRHRSRRGPRSFRLHRRRPLSRRPPRERDQRHRTLRLTGQQARRGCFSK